MTGSEGDLLDANVWLALTVAGHRHHVAAQTWIKERESDPLVFCRVTQMALLRHLTTPAIMGGDVSTQKEAWKIYNAALSRPGAQFRSEPTGLESRWQGYSERKQPAAKLWTDAYLAAFAQGHSLKLITFDQGFTHYTGTEVQLLGAKK